MTNNDLLSREDIKSINGYEGLYVISEDGEVWSLSREYINNKGKTTKIKPIKKINQFIDSRKNYKMIVLRLIYSLLYWVKKDIFRVFFEKHNQ